MKTVSNIFFLLVIMGLQYSMAQTHQLVWSDEFNYTGLPDNAKWDYDEGGSGWGNNELQYYTKQRSQNARVENGKLIIEAIKESYGGKNYTSARLVSRGKGDWLYGRFEIRAKLPSGKGTWPAIWMLPTDWAYGAWPQSGEIDIMEEVGYDPNVVHGSIHTKAYNHTIGTQKTASTNIPDAQTAFHVYALDWTADSIKISVDDKIYFRFRNEGTWEKWPFDKRFHMILNIAVGGNWGGAQGVDDAIFPTRMEIDYVRVYQKIGAITVEGPSFAKPDEQNLKFQTANIVDATYQWSVPSDATIVSGNNTNAITVKWGKTDGDVAVQITYNSKTETYKKTVQTITKPESSVYIISHFNDNVLGWSDPDSDNNTFNISNQNQALKLVYTTANPSLLPRIEYTFNRPIDLSQHPTMRIRLKTYNKSGSVRLRADLVDVYGVQTNYNNTFNILNVNNDGWFHNYEYKFTGNWRSSSPTFGAKVDSSQVQKVILYVNYGVFGSANKTDSLWIDQIDMTSLPLKTLELSASSELQIYPNPATDKLFVHHSNVSDKWLHYTIYSTDGRIIETRQPTTSAAEQTINISRLQAGTYILIVQTLQNNYQHRFVKY